MRAWVWDQSWENNLAAADLFVLMTVDIWLTVADHSLLTMAPHPTTLQEAMQTWTIAGLERAFANVAFVASNGDVQGGRTGQKQQRFSDMVKVFFPLPDTAINGKSLWNTLAQKGYIGEYHRIVASLSSEGRETLNQALEVIFQNLQCLPNARPCGNGRNLGRIWKARDGMVEIMTNSRFYRLVSIGGNTRKKRGHTARIKASNAVIAAKLDEEHCGVPYKKGRKQTLLACRSAKSRNYRMPPTKPAKTTNTGVTDDTAFAGDEGSPQQEGGKPSTKSKIIRNAPAKPSKKTKLVNVHVSSDESDSEKSVGAREERSSDNGGSYEKVGKYTLRPRPSTTSNAIPNTPAKPTKKTKVTNLQALSEEESGSDNGASSESRRDDSSSDNGGSSASSGEESGSDNGGSFSCESEDDDEESTSK
jgi:hypothetical protein